MKKNILIASFAASMMLSGCVDLTQEPSSFLTPGTMVYDQKTIEIMANGLYKDLWFGNYAYNCRAQILGIGADDIVTGAMSKRYKNIDELDVNSGLHDEDVELMWQNMYAVVRSANFMLKNVGDTQDVTEEVKNPYLGEAYFMRAFAYFNLVRYFGDVPALTDPDCNVDINGSSNIKRTSVKDIYDKIIVPDLIKAETLLPERARTNDNSRASRAAAKACLADVYMTMAGWPLHLGQKYYELARDKAKEIIDHKDTKAYDLVKDYADLWKEAKKSDDTEHIFALNHDQANGMASNYGRSYYMIEESSSAWSDYLADSCFYERHPKDARKDCNFVANFKMEGTVRPKSYKTTSMRSPAIKKYRDYTPVNSNGDIIMTAQTDGITPVYRYAEVLLMYAEAQCQADGAPNSLAEDCLDAVRRRASKNGKFTSSKGMGKEEFLQAVFDERGWEFFAEFKRWFHLIRTEKVVTANSYNPRVAAALKAKGISDQDADDKKKTYYWMPLPVQEVQLNGFEQNLR